MSSAPEVLVQLAELFSVARCREDYQKVLKPLVTSCINSENRESRLEVLLKYLEYTGVCR